MFKAFLCAVSTLTVVSPGKDFRPDDKAVSRSADFYPVTGLILGIVLGLAAVAAYKILPAILCAVLLTFLSEIPTRAFHLDGLSDTFDGFFSSRSKEKMMEIMHDSRCGVMGVLVILAWGLVKFGAFLTLIQNTSPLFTGYTVFFMTLYGRCALVYHLSLCPYAREEGLAKKVFDSCHYFGIATGVIFSGSIWFLNCSFFWNILPALLLVWCYIWSRYTERKIGGGTGDTLGACEELTEVLVLLSFAYMPM